MDLPLIPLSVAAQGDDGAGPSASKPSEPKDQKKKKKKKKKGGDDEVCSTPSMAIWSEILPVSCYRAPKVLDELRPVRQYCH